MCNDHHRMEIALLSQSYLSLRSSPPCSRLTSRLLLSSSPKARHFRLQNIPFSLSLFCPDLRRSSKPQNLSAGQGSKASHILVWASLLLLLVGYWCVVALCRERRRLFPGQRLQIRLAQTGRQRESSSRGGTVSTQQHTAAAAHSRGGTVRASSTPTQASSTPFP